MIAKTVSLARPTEFIKYVTTVAGDIIITHHRSRNNYIHHLKSMMYIKPITAYLKDSVLWIWESSEVYRYRGAQHLEKMGKAGCQGTWRTAAGKDQASTEGRRQLSWRSAETAVNLDKCSALCYTWRHELMNMKSKIQVTYIHLSREFSKREI